MLLMGKSPCVCLAVENKQNNFNSVGEMGVSSNFCGNCINHKTEEKLLLMQVQSDNVTLLETSIVLTELLCAINLLSNWLRCFSCVELAATVNMSK